MVNGICYILLILVPYCYKHVTAKIYARQRSLYITNTDSRILRTCQMDVFYVVDYLEMGLNDTHH